MMNNISILLALLITFPMLAGCTSQQSNVFGEEKAAPDEFAVYSRAPLSLPPNFGLRPPKPGASRPQTLMPRNDAKDALLSNAGAPAVTSLRAIAQTEIDQSPGVVALLTSTGADKANPNIRSLVNNETAAISGGDDEGFADNILFWKQSTGLKGAVIDPAVEERRIRKKNSSGDVIEETAAPIIKRDTGSSTLRSGEDKGFWASLFN